MPKLSLAVFSVIETLCGSSYLLMQFWTISVLGTSNFTVDGVVLDKYFNVSSYFRYLQKYSELSILCLGMDLARHYCRMFLLYLGCILRSSQ